MNILFSAHIKSTAQHSACRTLFEVINSPQNILVAFLTKNKYSNTLMKEYQNIYELNQLPDNKYDLILAYNKTGLEKIKPFASKSGLPIIYLLNTQDIEQEYPDEMNQLSKIILLNPVQDLPRALYQKELTALLQLPTELSKARDFKLSDRKKPKVLVAIEHSKLQFSPLYRVAPLLNTLINFEVNILCKNKSFPGIFNSNIRVHEATKTNIGKLIETSDIIIGSGDCIGLVISNCKPCIVIGEQGYGGILNKENFEQQYQNNFQGRIGGTPGEYIPEKLLMEDILDLLEWDDERINKLVQANHQLLKKEHGRVQKQFNSLIEQVVKEHQLLNGSIEKASLKLSGAFSISPFSKEKYVLANAQTRQVHSHIEKEEAEIIGLFKDGSTVQEAMQSSGYKEEPEMFNEFVSELVNEKILVVDGN